MNRTFTNEAPTYNNNSISYRKNRERLNSDFDVLTVDAVVLDAFTTVREFNDNKGRLQRRENLMIVLEPLAKGQPTGKFVKLTLRGGAVNADGSANDSAEIWNAKMIAHNEIGDNLLSNEFENVDFDGNTENHFPNWAGAHYKLVFACTGMYNEYYTYTGRLFNAHGQSAKEFFAKDETLKDLNSAKEFLSGKRQEFKQGGYKPLKAKEQPQATATADDDIPF